MSSQVNLKEAPDTTTGEHLGKEGIQALDNIIQFRGHPTKENKIDTNQIETENEPMNTPSREEIDAKIGRASAEFNSSVVGLRKDMDVGFAEVRQEFSEVRKDMEVGFAQIRADMANQSKDTIKWAIGLAVAIISILLSASIAIFNKIDKPQQNQMQPVIVNIPAQQAAPTQQPNK